MSFTLLFVTKAFNFPFVYFSLKYHLRGTELKVSLNE